VHRVSIVVVWSLLALVAACASDGGGPAARSTDASLGPPSTTTATGPSPTTAPPPTSPLTAPQPPVEPEAARVFVTGTGVVVPVVAPAADGFVVTTPCGLEATVARGTALASADVVLDPGHGGDEQGAIGGNGLEEKDVNLDVAQRARDLLERQGHRVVLTRTADYRVTLATRAEIATALGARAFVSVHHNAEADGPSDGPGTETYYQQESVESRRLAGLIYEHVAAALDGYDVAWQADSDAGAKYRANERGGDYYGILRRSAGVPAVLSEAAYLSNPAEAELLADPEVRQAEAEALATAVERFLTTDDAGSGFVEPYPRTDQAGPGGGAVGCVDPDLGN
jgi:N-acetylmuramoyl-L-alanine amidase